MSRAIRILYRGLNGHVRMNFNWDIQPAISKKSVVVMSAAEAKVGQGLFGPEEESSFHLGDAAINVSPNGGVCST